MPTIDVPGIGAVQADNFASEQTLNRLIDAVNNQTTGAGGIQSIFATVAGDSRRAAADLKRLSSSTTTQSKVTDETSSSVQNLGRSSSGVSAAFSSFANRVNSIDIENPGASISSMLDSLGSKLFDVSKVAGIGLAASGNVIAAAVTTAAGAVAKFGTMALGVAAGDIDKMGQEYRKAANNGALFGQSMLNFRTFAHTAGLTMGQFNNVLEKNREQVSMFGMATTEGAAQFSNANANVIRQYGGAFQRMGFTFEEIGNNTAEYLAAIAEGTPGVYHQAISMDEVTKGAFDLATQQKALAAINGTTIEQEKEKMRMQRKDAQMNAVLLGMSQKEREAVQALSAQFPQATQFIKEFVAFGGPVTKAGNMQAAMLPTLTGAISDTITTIQGGGDIKPSLEALDQIAKSSGAIISETEGMADLVKLQIAGSTNSIVQLAADNFEAQFKLMNKINSGTIANTLAELDKDSKGSIGNFVQATDAAAEAVNKLREALQISSTSISSLLDSFYRTDAGKAVLRSIANTVAIPAQGLQGAAVNMGTNLRDAGSTAPDVSNASAATQGRLATLEGGVGDAALSLLPDQIGTAITESLGLVGRTLTGTHEVAEKQLQAQVDLVEQNKEIVKKNNEMIAALQAL